tara:strand:- start:717 stop:965 length:249 start_codon:yes stop_codon:yes gene_type:complete
MSNKINEGVIDFIVKKAIGLIAGGEYRKAVKAFKGDKGIQRDLAKMAQAQKNMQKKIKARAKADPEFAKNFAKARAKYDKLF